MRTFLLTFQELMRYKSALVGLLILSFLVGIAIYAVVTIPYGEAVQLWRGTGEKWRVNPRNASPVWVDYFTPKKLARTLILDSGQAQRTEEMLGTVARRIEFIYIFDYNADVFPSELAITYKTNFQKKPPLVEVIWITPDGREFSLGRETLKQVGLRTQWHMLSVDEKLRRAIGGAPEKIFFMDPEQPERPVKGKHKIIIKAILFEPDAEISPQVIVYGTVHGMAGTDHLRRDIMVALLWGAPVALSFGLAASFGTVITSIIFAAISAWFGGMVDTLLQRLTEIRMVLPTLPILIMVGLFYSKSIWAILATLLVLNIIESSVKTYRAMFLQEKNAPYIEAARSYGAGSIRIIFRYLIPRVVPWLIPSFVLAVPSYVFLEASLSVLGLGDPVLPTWGKLLSDAYSQGALYRGYYYWVLEPAFLLMLSGFGFTLIGYTLDRIFNPKLREI